MLFKRCSYIILTLHKTFFLLKIMRDIVMVSIKASLAYGLGSSPNLAKKVNSKKIKFIFFLIINLKE